MKLYDLAQEQIYSNFYSEIGLFFNFKEEASKANFRASKLKYKLERC